MKKSITRVIVLLLALLLCMPLMAACKGKDGGEGTTAPVLGGNIKPGESDLDKRAQEKDNLPESVSTDYVGLEATTLSFHENYDLDTMGSIDGNSGDIVGDLVYRRNEKVKARLGITFNNQKANEQDWSAYSSKLAQLASSQDGTYDIIYTMGNSGSRSGAESGLFANVADLPMLSLESPWWKLDAMENQAFDKKVLRYLMGDIAITTYNKAGAIFVNANLFNAYFENIGLDGLYDLALAGDWTIEKLGEFASNCYSDPDQDGLKLGSNDIIGFGIGSTVRVRAMEYGFDVRRWSRDENDCIIADYDVERASTAVDALLKLLYNTEGVFYDSKDYIGSAQFPMGKMLFHENQLGLLKNLQAMEAKFGILPTPKLDKEQEEYTTVIQESSTLVTINSHCKDLTFASVAAEALCTESYRIVVLPYIETCMKVQYVRESRVGQIIQLILDSAGGDFFSLYNPGGLGWLISSSVSFEENVLGSQYQGVREAAETWLLQEKYKLYPELKPQA